MTDVAAYERHPPEPIGLLLAAGAGRRMGRPKALVHDQDGRSWLNRAVRALLDGGCASVVVVLGAEAAQARRLLEDAPPVTMGQSLVVPVVPVVAEEWQEGMSASLRAGLRAAASIAANDGSPARTLCLTLVDLPDVGARVVRRVLEVAGEDPWVLARAAYDGAPGHPVVLGRDHWAPLGDQVTGDRGARDYLATRPVTLVECGDLAAGHDVDSPGIDLR